MHPKAIEASNRQKSAKEAKISKKLQEEEEDSLWEDDTKTVKRRQRKEEQLVKHQQHLAKKAEAKLLLEQETNSLKSGKPPKITRAQIRVNSRPGSAKTTKSKEKLFKNFNRVKADEINARSVEEALEALNEAPRDDKHPEKRRKAAFQAFEARRVPKLRKERPELKFSQVMEIVFKEWQKAPENPMKEN